jgi:hypothetical protein
MTDTRKSGYLVETKAGKIGRTFHNKGTVNGKIPVYVATEMRTTENKDGSEFEFPVAFSSQAILCDPTSLKHVGFID